jgi:hypothetical protein
VTDDPLVQMRHFRQAQHCAAGIKAMCEKYHADYRELVLRGLPASRLEATGDALAINVARIAREEAHRGR